jgi:hypothetical protein
LIVFLAACSGDSPSAPDAAFYDGSMTSDAQSCFGSGTFTICIPGDPSGPLAVSSTTAIDTSQDTTCTFVQPQPLGPDLCVVTATSINITGMLVATGSRPLALLSTGGITITGTIDVSSTSTRDGPGANDSSCPTAGAGTGSTTGAGGGAGGSFGSVGGSGGKGSSGAVGAGSAAAASGTPSLVRGGCKGGAGGVGTATDDPPGSGGGALYLLAAGTLTNAGTINFSGSGGGRGRISKGGGSGGGSGGMLALWAADLVTKDGTIYGNGGGGGGGADNGVSGNAGQSPSSATAAAPGGGGGGGGGPGAGGPGAFGTTAAVNGIQDTTGAGGGGGGGGVGIIRVISGQQLAGTVSPPPS